MKPILSAVLTLALTASVFGQEAYPLGGKRALFVDDVLIDQLVGVQQQLNPPVARETVFTFDAPWEGSGSDFERLIRVGSTLRMYYMATELTTSDGLKIGNGTTFACVAESTDGIHWTRPDLGIFEFQGSKHNNIVWAQPKLDNFTPFIDTNPACPADEKFKATSGGRSGLFAFKSADGLHWSKLQEEPIIVHGMFDTQNNAFWDPVAGHYWCYLRGFHDEKGQTVTDSSHGTLGIRDIRVSSSSDFKTWSEPQRLRFTGSPDEALYTNQIERYYRAPDVLVGFPTRYSDRKFSAAALEALPDPAHRRRRMSFSPRYGTVVTDGQFMTSRDGLTFHRWDEPYLRPGPERSNNWLYGDGYQSLGLIETPASDPSAPNELSFYADEGHWKDGETVRRYTTRIDGFVSIHAKEPGGILITKPFTFSGRKLSLNFATSAAGAIRVELEDAAGHALPGFSLGESDELFGDTLDRTVTWNGRSDVSGLAGKPVRLRVSLIGADLYSFVVAP